ncbi:MAG: hypothetical protein A2481_00905 [Candidatus Yonathbacteria bacterium RIFOXYC2_FULL_47_9]|nr:MAG: hypothetical protein A2481_00905 [Candidatus Yonathbacteria bacterium RIFOXYC2_FULL_47_9]HAT68776.1 hypothetical protein [Candidatus Yonathbacteria bacterium]
MKKLKIAGVILGILLLFGAGQSLFITYRFHLKPIVNFMVNHWLTNSCNNQKGCTEVRPLPGLLQGKKIVFSSNTDIFFEPFSRSEEVTLADLDTLGNLDTVSSMSSNETFVDPALSQRGYLKEREYKIIRAMYHYNCLYCIDGSDYSFIVLEDPTGNRFTSILNKFDSSVDPWRDLPWDEYLPYYIGKDKNGKEMMDANLVDIY